MLFIPNNTEDISRYYKNTFVKFKETGDTLFYIKYVKNDCVQGVSQDGTPFELYLGNEFPYEVEYVLPHKSYFQWKECACLLQRIPAKQYQRGISNNNTSLHYLRSTGSVGEQSLDFDVLAAFVSKQMFLSLEAAVESDKDSVVLSPRMAFVPHSRKIYIDFLCVGQLTPKRKGVKCFYEIFRPELTNLVMGTDYKVL